MTDTIFFRLLDGVNRPSRLSDAIEELHKGGETADAYSAEPTSLQQVPNSPLAYWVSDKVRNAFVTMSSFKTAGRDAQFGASTKNDFRFLRAWWEVPADLAAREREETFDSRRWVPYAKGGAYSPFYVDWELVLDWGNDGEVLKKEISEYRGSRGWGYHWTASLNGHASYFRSGLTWPRSTVKGLSVRILPKGCIFGDKGPAAFETADHPTSLAKLLAVMNSRVFQTLMLLQTGSRAWEVGFVQRTPVPDLSSSSGDQLETRALETVSLKRNADSTDETSHVYCLPALTRTQAMTLQGRLAHWQNQVSRMERQIAEHQREIDDVVFNLYGIEGADRQAIEESLGEASTAVSSDGDEPVEAEDAEEAAMTLDGGTLVADLLSYAVGCVFGRWDVRIALDPSLASKLADPFALLPVCSPGMLVGPDELPAKKDGIASEEWTRARPDAITPPPEGSVENPTISDSKYPLAVDWDGILVDDPDHPDDVVRRVREVLELLWGERADEIEGEACDLLGVKDLRAYFRNPKKFFEFHVKRYSKSRRKAPIYWLLQSPKRSYGLWLYYHRLDPDILFKALTKYVEPKIRLEESRLEEYEARRRSAGTGGREAKGAEKALAKGEELLTDLREFRDRLDRAAKLHLRPDLNDGVVLNIAPLHELVPWKEAKSKWNELLSGKYEWSSIGKQLREKGIV